jgi:hypothetical protein
MADTMDVEILEDGTLKITTGKVSMANHMNAEAFLRQVATLCGGKTERKQKEAHQGHHHGNMYHVHN